MSEKLEQGQKVAGEYSFPLPNSDKIIKDNEFLLSKIYGEMNISHDEEKLQKDFAKFKEVAGFFDKHFHKTTVEHGNAIQPHYNKKNQSNEYAKPVKKAFKKFAKRGYEGLTVKEEFGGFGMSKAVTVGLATSGFNGSTLFLNHMVVQGDQNLLQEAHAYDKGNPAKQEMLENIIRQIKDGKASGAMILTEPESGNNIGQQKSYVVKANDDKGDDKYKVHARKKYITGYTLGGVKGVKNAFAVIVTNTQNNGALTNKATVTLVPLYKIDAKGNLIKDKQGKPIKNEGITTSHWIKKPGIKGQILQQHEFDGAEGILLGKEGEGWNMMFECMSPARLEVAAQALGHAYNAYTLVESHTTKKHLNTSEGVPIALRPTAIEKTNQLKAFTEIGSAVLIKIGTDIDNSRSYVDRHGKLHSGDTEAQNLIKLESSLAKAYFTKTAMNLVTDKTAQLLGADGFISEALNRIKNDLAPTPIYEGSNEMMAKQIVVEHFDKLPTFIAETKRVLKNIYHPSIGEKDNKAIREVKNCFESFETAYDILAGKHEEFKKAKTSGNEISQQQIATEILTASEKFLDHMGAVMMGREALRVVKTCLQEKGKPITKQYGEELDDRMITARAAINSFVTGKYPINSKEIEKQYFTTPELTNEIEHSVEKNVVDFNVAGKNDRENRIEMVDVKSLSAKAVNIKIK